MKVNGQYICDYCWKRIQDKEKEALAVELSDPSTPKTPYAVLHYCNDDHRKEHKKDGYR